MNNRNFKVYTARPVQLALGTSEGSTTIYAKLKNGSVWSFTAPSVELANAWIEFIKRQGTITLNGWKCVRKKPAQPKRAPAKEVEFDKSQIASLRKEIAQLKKDNEELYAEGAEMHQWIEDHQHEVAIAKFEKPRAEYDEQADIEHATKMWEFEKSGDREGMIKYLDERLQKSGLGDVATLMGWK